MKREILTLALAALTLTCVVVAAQPGGFGPPGDEGSAFRGRLHEQRLERMTAYLELDERQAEEWQLILDNHLAAVGDHRERMENLRDEFHSLADAADPDLQRLGQLALGMHREGLATRSLWDQVSLDLEALLTPEQAERFAALKAARDMADPRFGLRGPHVGRQRPEAD